MTDAEKAALEHLARHKELELEYSDSAHIGIFLAGVKWAAPKWISVKERLPKIYQPVICFGEPSRGGYAWTFCSYEGNHIWRFFFDGAENKSIITHWLPLPEPPKEEK